MTELHDRELVARFIRRKDEEAFRELFRRHSPRLYAIAFRMMGGRVADAEDVVQDVWLRAATQLRGFEWRSALTTWLTSIAINCARERLRRSGRDAIGDVDVAEAATPPVSSRVSAIDLDRAIASLADGYREAIVLHDIEGYTHEEIAAGRGVSVGTSKSQLFRARALVRARLKG